MRDNLTSNFIAAMQEANRKPIQFMVFHFSFGDICLSDRDVSLFGTDYEGLVEDWGESSTVGTGNSSDIIAETQQLTISILNTGDSPFSDYFAIDDPINVKVDVYQTFEGLLEEDTVLIDKYVIQDPVTIPEASRIITLDLVSENMLYSAKVGTTLNKSDWPNALDSDINRGIDLIIGDAGTVKTLCAKTPYVCTMTGSILKLPTTVYSHEDLDEVGFPQDGYIVIDSEIMHYFERTSNSFNVDLRGSFLSLESEHSDGAAILEFITDHTFLIGQGPLTSVSDVRAGGLPADPSSYYVDTSSNPARIIFESQPSYISYSKGARSIDVDFDSDGLNNTAYQPHYSYDISKKSYGALISKNYPTLSILQNDPAIDEGEVVRAFISVEHWETAQYENDRVDIWVDGIGVVGVLSKPNAEDITSVSGDIDIDHEHDHVIGGIHDHDFANPGLNTDNPTHKHATTSAGPEIVSGGSIGLPTTIYAYTSNNSIGSYFGSISGTNFLSRTIRVRFKQTGLGGVRLSVTSFSSGTPIMQWDSADKTVDQLVTFNYTNSTLYLIAQQGGVSGGNLTIYEFTSATVYSGEVEYFQTAVDTAHTTIGDVAIKNVDTTGTLIKDQGDVDPLATANRQLENIATTSASKKVTDKFDLTEYLETISWDWFQDRQVELRYIGSLNAANVLITYVNFQVEYRQRETIITNDVTCKAVGSLNNRPDKVIEYLLCTVAGVPFETLGSIRVDVEVWDDLDTWVDLNTWLDGGERLPVYDDPGFEDAAERFAYLGYTIDGVISADGAIQDVIKEICKQTRSRLVWSAGQAKLAVRETIESWQAVKELTPNELQLKSISTERTKVSEIQNDISISYQVNRLSDAENEGKYDNSVTVVDNDSISKNGQKKDNSMWLFDLVRDEAMAADLANYYIWKLGAPSTLYTMVSYLQQFDIEKEDVFRFTSDFTRAYELPVRVIDAKRTFGSGKLNKINTITFTGESIRHKTLFVSVDETAIITETFTIGRKDEEDANDSMIVSEELLIVEGKAFFETPTLSESVVVSASYGPSFDEDIICSEDIGVSLLLSFEDSIILDDSTIIKQELCFGACGFGLLPFGSVTTWADSPISNTSANDYVTLIMGYSLELDDNVTALDEIEGYDTYEETVGGFVETLIFNTGFGCTISGASGFGESNFGQ